MKKKVGDMINGHVVTEVRDDGSIVAEPEVEATKEVKQLAERLCSVLARTAGWFMKWEGVLGSSSSRDLVRAYEAAAADVLANFVPKEEASKPPMPGFSPSYHPEGDEECVKWLVEQFEEAYISARDAPNGNHEKGREAAARYALQLLGAPKATISEKNLEELAEGHHYHLKGARHDPNLKWKGVSKYHKQQHREVVLSMLNCDVAAAPGEHAELVSRGYKTGYADAKEKYLATPAVDFVVTGKDGERLIPVGRQPSHWTTGWETLPCSEKRGRLADMYGEEHGDKSVILLDCDNKLGVGGAGK